MKKLGMMLVIACFLAGCISKKNVETLNESQTYTLQEQLEFEIIKTEVIQRIEPSNKNKDYKYLKAKDENNTFVDVVMKTINLTSKELSLKDIFSGSYEINKQTYDLNLAIETINYNQISTTDSLKSNEDRYIHLYCEVPKEQIKDDAVIKLKVLDKQEYTYTFSMEQQVIKNDTKSLGDVLTLENSQIVLNQISQSNKIEPSNKGLFYSYIPTDNSDETFVILQVDLKNTGDTQLNLNEYLYCEYYIGKDKIQSMIVIENENHKSVSKTGSIDPDQTRTLYLAMPVKNDRLSETGEIHLFVEGRTFIINNKS